MARPQPIIIPGPTGLGGRTQKAEVDLGGILALVKMLGAPGRRKTEAADIVGALPQLGVGGLEQEAAGPPGFTGAFPTAPTEAGQRLERLGGTKGGLESLRNLFGLAAQQSVKPREKSIFAPVGDIAQFTQESIKIAERTGSRGELVLKPQFLRKKLQRSGDPQGDLRKEWTKLNKDFILIRDSFGRIEASAEDPSAAGDLALIFNYMKMLDPGSVVRESEFATAANAAGVPDRVRNIWNKVLSGKKLAPEQRKDFTRTAGRLMDKQLKQLKKNERTYKKIATDSFLNVENTIIDLTTPEIEEAGVIPTGAVLQEDLQTKEGNPVYRLPTGELWTP